MEVIIMSNENNIKLLMVDDEVKFLESISKRLELKNFDVTTATNGQEAIASAEKGLFDVAVVDFKMPGMDGTEVLKALKENHKYLEIIMLTGHATIDSAVECTKMGAFKYLEKPYDFEKLVELIMEAYEARLKKKFENNQKRVEEIQKLSISSSPLGLLRALARLDDEEK
jgi:DNA-binding NtrC family response regulator